MDNNCKLSQARDTFLSSMESWDETDGTRILKCTLAYYCGIRFLKIYWNAFSEREKQGKKKNLLKGGKVEVIFKILSTNPKVGIF